MPDDMTETPSPAPDAERRPIQVGDRLLCDGWAFGMQTFDNHPCVCDESERMVDGRMHVGARDSAGISHLYPAERFRHALPDPALDVAQEALIDCVARAIEPETFKLPRINLNRAAYDRAWTRARAAISAMQFDRLRAENAGLREALANIHEVADSGIAPGASSRTLEEADAKALRWIARATLSGEQAAAEGGQDPELGRLAQATQIAMGHGKVDVGPIRFAGRIGLLLHPRDHVIPVGHPGIFSGDDRYWPGAGDVVIWLDGQELGQTIINELTALSSEQAAAGERG